MLKQNTISSEENLSGVVPSGMMSKLHRKTKKLLCILLSIRSVSDLQYRANQALNRIFPGRYFLWRLINSPSKKEIALTKERSRSLSYKPRISVIIPVYRSKLTWLKEAVNSVRNQTYPHWELCIADDASGDRALTDYLLNISKTSPLTGDGTIKVCLREKNGHISECTNSALTIATGEFIAFLDHDDVITPDALFEMARFLNDHSDADLIYSNEDKINARGALFEPTFKPEWSPDYFLSFMYLGHLALYRREKINEVGGFRVGVEGSQDYDLALRIFNAGARIYHLPKILYHWRSHLDSVAQNLDSKPYAFTAAKKALAEALITKDIQTVHIEDTRYRGIYRPRLVSSLKPTIDLLVHGGALLKEEAFAPHSLHYISGPLAVLNVRETLSQGSAEYVLFIKNSLLPDKESSLNELVELLSTDTQERRSGVGAQILNQNRVILHAGYSLNRNKVYHNFIGVPELGVSSGARLVTMTNVSALSLDCFLVRRSALIEALSSMPSYESRLGLEVDLGISLSDKKRGKYLTWSSHIKFIDTMQRGAFEHFTSLSERDFAHLNERHSLSTFKDPYYPEGLNRSRGDYSWDWFYKQTAAIGR